MPPEGDATRVDARELRPEDWPALERLFGPRGACGGCWCMYWRVPRGGRDWDSLRGARARRALRDLVRRGRAAGCLAWSDGQPVGWCCAGPREEFPRLARSRALRPEGGTAGPDTWSVVCFFVPARWRRRGVAAALLDAAVNLARRRGARRVEGYPVPVGPGVRYPAAFAWTGVPRLFEAARFRPDPDVPSGRVWVRRVRPAAARRPRGGRR